MKGPILIIGAGPAGLGAAYRLSQAGCKDWVLFERDNVVGGLSRSFIDHAGFTWDIGGHVTFSHYPVFTNLLNSLLGSKDWIDHMRESYIRILNTWVPYPFQNNIHRLPVHARARCAEGLIRAAMQERKRSFSNFDEFIVETFGEGIAELFMRPYNYKVWAYHPADLDASWIADRVAVPDPMRIVRNLALSADDCDWGPNNTYRFPRTGGTGAIWEALAASLPRDKVLKNCEVERIDTKRRILTLMDGRTQHYRSIISTIPLNLLTKISGRKRWIEITGKLTYSSVYVVGVGLHGKPAADLATKCWMYFPEGNCPFYRVTHFSLYSPNNVDDINSHWSLMCEISESPKKPVNPAKVIDDTIDGLVATNLINGHQQVEHTWRHRVEYAYPTPTKTRDEVLRTILPELSKHGILSRGRFGGWRYEVGNMDHSFMQGYEAAGNLLDGEEELTLWQPEVVNRMHG